MAVLSSNRNKIILLLLISLLVFGAWQAGLETAYAKVLVATTNFSLKVVKTDTRIEFEEKEGTDGLYQFRVFTVIDGREGNYPQEPGTLLQPFVIVLSWQIFLFFILKRKAASKLLLANTGIYLFVQIVFLILLTGYYTSSIQQYIFTVMLDSFYIVALILVIKDNMLYPVFSKRPGNRGK
ncbi:MAG: hypothetical protein L3J31_07775 [Bacteroidales bacterium]|nr:hypothetical protein [Bacteroidales bacterium]MCF6342684.1 hypothetical protein [Bacteroidales bacterium]